VEMTSQLQDVSGLSTLSPAALLGPGATIRSVAIHIMSQMEENAIANPPSPSDDRPDVDALMIGPVALGFTSPWPKIDGRILILLGGSCGVGVDVLVGALQSSAYFAPFELHLLSFETMTERSAYLATRQSPSWGGIDPLWAAVATLKNCPLAEARRYIEEEAGAFTVQVYQKLVSLAGPRVLMDVTPTNAMHINFGRRARQMFEQPSFLSLVRHPMACISSAVHAQGQHVTADLAARRTENEWVNSNAIIHTLMGELNDALACGCTTIRYEELRKEDAKKHGGSLSELVLGRCVRACGLCLNQEDLEVATDGRAGRVASAVVPNSKLHVPGRDDRGHVPRIPSSGLSSEESDHVPRTASSGLSSEESFHVVDSLSRSLPSVKSVPAAASCMSGDEEKHGDNSGHSGHSCDDGVDSGHRSDNGEGGDSGNSSDVEPPVERACPVYNLKCTTKVLAAGLGYILPVDLPAGCCWLKTPKFSHGVQPGQPTILFPGIVGGAVLFDELVPQLAARTAASSQAAGVVAVEYSMALLHGCANWEDLVGKCAQLVRQMLTGGGGPKPLKIIGYSFGCRIAYAVAGFLSLEHKVQLCLLDGPLGGPRGALEEAMLRAPQREMHPNAEANCGGLSEDVAGMGQDELSVARQLVSLLINGGEVAPALLRYKGAAQAPLHGRHTQVQVFIASEDKVGVESIAANHPEVPVFTVAGGHRDLLRGAQACSVAALLINAWLRDER